MNVIRLVKWDGQIIMEFELLVVTCFCSYIQVSTRASVHVCTYTSGESLFKIFHRCASVRMPGNGCWSNHLLFSWVFPTTIHCPCCHFLHTFTSYLKNFINFIRTNGLMDSCWKCWKWQMFCFLIMQHMQPLWIELCSYDIAVWGCREPWTWASLGPSCGRLHGWY